MEKIIYFFLFVLAIFAGIGLFMIGKRTIQQTSQSKCFGRFLIYLSIVVVFMSGGFSFSKSIEKTAVAQERKKEIKKNANLNRNAKWNNVVRYWQRLRAISISLTGKLPEKIFQEYKKGTSERITKLKELKEADAISEEMHNYVKFHLENCIWHIEMTTNGKNKSDDELSKRFIKGLKLQNLIQEQLRKEKLYDKSLSSKFKETLGDSFKIIKAVKFKKRLKPTSLSKEEYKKLVCKVIDNAFFYIRKSNPIIINPPKPRPPVAQPEYGVRPLYGVRPPRPMPKYGVRPQPRPIPNPKINQINVNVKKIEGDIYEKVSGGVWTKLKKGKYIFFATVFENKGEKIAKIELSNGMQVEIQPGSVVTGWELNPAVPKDIKEKIKNLIKKLGGSTLDERNQAEKELSEIGHLAQEELKKALKNGDAEMRIRIKRIMKLTKTKVDVPAILDNLK